MAYFFTRELSETEQLDEVEQNILRGNHKSCINNIKIAPKELRKNVEHG